MFSVVIPIFNGARFVDSAIQCVYAQTYPDWEIIVVDDGSTDDTPAALEKYKSDKRIKIYRQENSGVSAARNAGMDYASSELIAFLDVDDLWRENHLSVLNKMVTAYPDAGFYATFAESHLVNGDIIAACNYFKDKPDIVYIEDFLGEYDRDKSVKMFNTVSTCVRKTAAKRAGGFPLGCRIGEDLELALRIAAYYPFVLSKCTTAIYQKANSTATKDISFDPDWGFFDTVQPLYADESIPASKRENLRRVMQWFTMRRCRHYLISGSRKKAIAAYRAIDMSCISKKDHYMTALLLFLPVKLVNKIFCIRWRSRA